MWRGDCGAPFEACSKAPSEAKWGGGEGGIAGFLSEHTRILSCVADYDLLARALAPTQKCGLGSIGVDYVFTTRSTTCSGT